MIKFTRTAVQNCKANIAFKYSNNSRKSILNRLVEAVDIDTNEKLSEDQLIAESIVQLIAGTETTSLTLMWTIYLLLQNPETYHLLVDELYKALPDQQSSISHAEIKGLSYLNAVLYESMRLRPVVPTGSPRQVPLGGATICGFHIPEKSSNAAHGVVSNQYVTYPVTYIVHHLDSVFGPDPQEFRPSRWLDSSSEQLAVMRQTFLGFSIGTRACVGRNLAWLELRLTLAVLIRRFDFSVPEDAKVNMTPALEFVLKPRARQFLVKAESRPT
ncbi:cytochrome P450 [Syncephalis fuscata]|nr:cytochrome P450 [Syncephalis fuscata]